MQNNIHLVLMSHAKHLPYGLSIIPTWDKAFLYLKLVLHSMCNSSTAASISAFIQSFSSFCDNRRFLKMNLAAPATSRCLYFCSLVRHISHEHFRTSTRCKVFFFFHKHSLFSNIFIKKPFSGFLNLQTILVFLCLLSSIHQLSA